MNKNLARLGVVLFGMGLWEFANLKFTIASGAFVILTAVLVYWLLFILIDRFIK